MLIFSPNAYARSRIPLSRIKEHSLGTVQKKAKGNGNTQKILKVLHRKHPKTNYSSLAAYAHAIKYININIDSAFST
jgi:hypothetical protein